MVLFVCSVLACQLKFKEALGTLTEDTREASEAVYLYELQEDFFFFI